MNKDINAITESITDQLMGLLPLVRHKLLKPAFEHIGKEISHHHLLILKILAASGPKPVSSIGRCIALSKPEMTFLTDKLCTLGYIERKPDEFDRRVVNIELTIEGRKFLRKSLIKARDIIKQKLAILDIEELKEVETTLIRLTDLTSKID
jgi:DNA-binding MarR family transcriptional regulator